jgi:type II secretion system protein D
VRDGARSLTIAVDQSENDLLIDSPQSLATGMVNLVRQFETIAGRADQTARILPCVSDVHELARRLRAPLTRLATAQADAPPPRPQLPPRPANGAAPNALPPANAAQPPAGGDRLKTLVEELTGDVHVEVLEDLGVLVVSGNRSDVDAVVKMVRAVEMLGVGAAPEIHVRFLSHVSSESMAELLGGVYDRLGQLPGLSQPAPAAAVLPVVKPNAVVIVATQADLSSILELTDQLDRPSDPRTQFQVFRLKYAVAARVLELIDKLYDERAGLAARVSTVIDARTNSVIVRGSPADLAEVGALIKRIDLDESNAVSQMRLFPLKNAVAEELAEVIRGAIQSVLSARIGQSGSPLGGSPTPSGQGSATTNRRFQTAKSVVLQFLTGEGGAQQSVRSGILQDIRVSFDARTNSLMVTAPRQSMYLMTELIRQLDQPTALVSDIKVFSLANSDAASMVRLLQDLYAAQTSTSPTAVRAAGGADAGSHLIPLRLSVDVRTNSIIAKGAPETLQVVEAILLRLDQSDLRQRESVVIRLKNSPAEDVAKAINEFLESRRDISQIDPNLVSTAEMLEREVIVVAEPVSNSLLISSTPRYFDEIKALTERLDEAPRQVIIQALLVEVELDNEDEFGLELGVQNSILFDRSVVSNLVTLTETTTSPNGVQTTTQIPVSQESTPGFLFNNQQLGNNTAISPSTVGGQALSAFNLGRINGDLGYGGLVLSAGSESLSVLLRALAESRNIDILSRPQIRTLDNQLAQIQVGQQVPIVDGINVATTGASNPLIRQENAGIILTVTPRISPEKVIVMEVIAEKSAFDKNGVPIYTDTNTGVVVRSPVKNITTARTTVSVPNDQTIVLGGMITNLESIVQRKVPWLGDVPLLGHGFRYDSAIRRRTELLIFLTPRIIENDCDSEIIKQVEAGRIHFCEAQAEAIHGPLYGVPEEPITGPFPYEAVPPAEALMPPEPTIDP